MKKERQCVIYKGDTTHALKNGKTYEVYKPVKKGVQVYIKTGFAGIPVDNYEPCEDCDSSQVSL